MLYHYKYKLLIVSLDGTVWQVPTIHNSYIYTLWVLRHKYKDIKLHDVQVKYLEELNDLNVLKTLNIDTPSNIIPVNIPNITPMLNIYDVNAVISYLGVDAYLILHGESTVSYIMDTIHDDLSLNKNKHKFISFFDMYVVKMQIDLPKIWGVSPTYKGTKLYKYTAKSRKTFNRHAELLRKKLSINSNRTSGHKIYNNKVDLTPVERDYYETQLQEFVFTYIYKGDTNYAK